MNRKASISVSFYIRIKYNFSIILYWTRLGLDLNGSYIYYYRLRLANKFLGEGENKAMKPDIHPTYEAIKVSCACGNSFETRSTMSDDLNIEICSQCHPFFTGKQKLVDTAGRVDRFKKRFARRTGSAPATAEK